MDNETAPDAAAKDQQDREKFNEAYRWARPIVQALILRAKDAHTTGPEEAAIGKLPFESLEYLVRLADNDAMEPLNISDATEFNAAKAQVEALCSADDGVRSQFASDAMTADEKRAVTCLYAMATWWTFHRTVKDNPEFFPLGLSSPI